MTRTPLESIPLSRVPATDLRLRLAQMEDRPVYRMMWVLAWELDLPVDFRDRIDSSARKERMSCLLYAWANEHGLCWSMPEIAHLMRYSSHSTVRYAMRCRARDCIPPSIRMALLFDRRSERTLRSAVTRRAAVG